jgi:sigma-B regulation protein RsbU (phosphoserine phosphatase)
MAVVKGMMISLATIYTSPAELLSELNRRLYHVMGRNTFVTMNYAVFDTRKMEMTYASAGHNSILKREGDSGDGRVLEPEGLGLGLEKGDVFHQSIQERIVSFRKGDTFLLFTDGITEAMNREREEYGEEALKQTFFQTDSKDASTIRKSLLQSVRQFVRGAPQHDDMTMVVIRVV